MIEIFFLFQRRTLSALSNRWSTSEITFSEIFNGKKLHTSRIYLPDSGVTVLGTGPFRLPLILLLSTIIKGISNLFGTSAHTILFGNE